MNVTPVCHGVGVAVTDDLRTPVTSATMRIFERAFAAMVGGLDPDAVLFRDVTEVWSGGARSSAPTIPAIPAIPEQTTTGLTARRRSGAPMRNGAGRRLSTVW